MLQQLQMVQEVLLARWLMAYLHKGHLINCCCCCFLLLQESIRPGP
jgi:hypothetical protein